VWCWCSGPMAAAFSTSCSAVNETRRGQKARSAHSVLSEPFQESLGLYSMKGIVLVQLAVDEKTGRIDRDAPFLVIAPQSENTGLYDNKPDVIAQIACDEREARFEAEWVDGKWIFGKRVADA
jgi:hypothetical protein